MREDEVYLSHIRDAIAQIQMYTTDGRESFFRNTVIRMQSFGIWKSLAKQ